MTKQQQVIDYLTSNVLLGGEVTTYVPGIKNAPPASRPGALPSRCSYINLPRGA